MAQKLYITIGLPGSGKSTWAKWIASSNMNIKIVNCDALSEMIHGRYQYDPKYVPVIRRLTQDSIMCLLEHGYTVIVDECHAKIAERQQLIKLVRNNFPHVQIHYQLFRVSPDECISRRKPGTWSYIIEAIAKKFEWPTEEECARAKNS